MKGESQILDPAQLPSWEERKQTLGSRHPTEAGQFTKSIVNIN